MAQAPELDFAAYVARKKGERVTGDASTSGHEYAYISDKQTRATVEKAPTETPFPTTTRPTFMMRSS